MDGQTMGDGQTISQLTGATDRQLVSRQSASNHDEQTRDNRLVTVNTIIDASFQDHESRNTIISSTQPLFWHHDLLMEWSDVVACQW